MKMEKGIIMRIAKEGHSNCFICGKQWEWKEPMLDICQDCKKEQSKQNPYELVDGDKEMYCGD